MATPMEIGAAVMGAAGLAMQVFQGCMAGYQMFHDAQQVGNEGDLLRLKLRIQQTRLQDFGQASAISSTQPSQRLNWPLIKAILEHQHGILAAGEMARKYYGLDSRILAGEVDGEGKGRGGTSETTQRTPQAKQNSNPASGLGLLFDRVRPDIYSNAARDIYTSNKPLRRVRWALVGSKKLNKIIDDLRELNDGLVQLLEPIQQAQTWSALETLYRDLLSRTSTLADVEILQKLAGYAAKDDATSLQSTAEFKKIRLLLGWDKRDDEVRPQEKPATYEPRVNRRYKPEQLCLTPGGRREGLTREKLGEMDILVEWRRIPGGLFKFYKPYLEQLAFLLVNAGASFAALSCLGHVVYKSESLWGYVYEPPHIPCEEEGVRAVVTSLAQMMTTARHVPLALRVDTALVVAKAVLELHTAGWLHKNINRERVIFVHGDDASNREIAACSPYLIGYEAARPDTEYGAALSEVADLGLEEQLYHHPDRHGTDKKSFKKLYDLYSLGCLLTEIALWQPLAVAYKESSGNDWPTMLREAENEKRSIAVPTLIDFVQDPTFCDTVEHAVGSQYLEAVKLCVQGVDPEEEDSEVSIKIERDVVTRLRASQQRRADATEDEEMNAWES